MPQFVKQTYPVTWKLWISGRTPAKDRTIKFLFLNAMEKKYKVLFGIGPFLYESVRDHSLYILYYFRSRHDLNTGGILSDAKSTSLYNSAMAVLHLNFVLYVYTKTNSLENFPDQKCSLFFMIPLYESR